jgi:P3 major capsid protein
MLAPRHMFGPLMATAQATSAGGGGGGKMTAAQLNAYARAAIKAKAIKMTQQIFNQTYGSAASTTDVSASQPVINIIPRNVGLIKGFYVAITATINNQAAETANLSDLGPSNLVTQFQFNDLNNNTRIQTTGWHIAFLNAIKSRRPYGTSFIRGGSASTTGGFDSPINYGNNYSGEISAPATIGAGDSGTVVMWWWVPLAYSDDDLRGAVYANVVNATMQLNVTLNPHITANSGTDSTQSVFLLSAGASAPSTDASKCVVSQLNIAVYQVYMDQLPIGQGGVLLPILDLATIYEMKNTVFTAITAGQDFPIQYSNFRDFLSTTLIYVNTGSTGARAGMNLTSGAGAGVDINYLALQSANFTNIWKKIPALVALETRNHLQADMPPGCYYFGSREKPISTVQYGNMELIINALTAGAGAYALLGYEDFALVQSLSMAGSLAAS